MIPRRKRILIPTDGSDITRAAISFALDLAKISDAEVTALYVNDISTSAVPGETSPDAVSPLYQQSLTVVKNVVDLGAKMGVDIEPRVINGVPVREIVDASAHYDLIVMGTASRTGVSLLILGSVAQQVIRFASCPVLVISSARPVGLQIKNILIPTDGNDNTKIAVRHGLEMARTFKADVTALFVTSTRTIPLPLRGGDEQFTPEAGQRAVDYVKREGEKRGIVVHPEIIAGSPANEIIRASGRHDLIVMGTNGRTGLDYLRLGSVAIKTVRHARCPVLVVRDVEPRISTI